METIHAFPAVSALIAAFVGGFGIGYLVGKRERKTPPFAKDTDFCAEAESRGLLIGRSISDNGITKNVDCEMLRKKRCTLTGNKCRYY